MHTPRVALAVAAVFSLAGCGGSDGLSKKDLAKKANAICDEAEKEGKKVPEPKNVQDANEAAAYFGKLAPIVQKQIDDLKALEPADSVKKDWDAFVAKEVAANDILQTVRKKADAKDASGLQDLQKLGTVADEIDPAAKKIGATRCT